MNNILIYFAIKYKGDWDKIYYALENKEKVSLKDIQDLEEEIKKENQKIITILDISYPQKLKNAYKPPFVLWYEGDLSTLDNNIITLSGNNADTITKRRIKEFAPEIEKSRTILQPSFKGVDEEINYHSSKSKVFVLPCGIKVDFNNFKPKESDFVITEYPPLANVSKDRLRNRNRIIASLSESLILFSSNKNGGMNNMVSNFLNLGKEIYCFPGDGSEKDGNSELIKQGASLITRIKDISN